MIDWERIRNLADSFNASEHSSLATIIPYQASFRRFWADKMVNDSVTELRELEDLDPIIRLLDTAGKRTYEYDESSRKVLSQRLLSSGDQYDLQYQIEDKPTIRKLVVKSPVGIAMCMVTQRQWYKIFRDIKAHDDLRSKLTELFTASDPQQSINLIDEIRSINETNENHLTSRQAVALNSFLFCYNMDQFTSVLSLQQRAEIVTALALGSIREEDSYGTRIINSNSLILSLNEKLGTKLDSRTLSSFLYTPEIRQIWEPQTSGGAPSSDAAYLILRTQQETAWRDEAGVVYHFGSNVPNYTKVNPGAFVVFDRNRDGQIQFSGKAQISEVSEEQGKRTTPEGKPIVEMFARLDHYERFPNLVPRSSRVSQMIDGLENYNNQHSIRVVNKEVFDQILAESHGSVLEIPDRWKGLFELLESGVPIILFGPPGTGKTFTAEELAKLFVKVKNSVEVPDEYIRTTQFHPSYSYEDFMEGITVDVKEDKGQLRYLLKNGIFKDLCITASEKKNQAKVFVLIIDEINRGNIPKIFGELLYAIERRGSRILLPYSREFLVIPKNIYIIGTMNTADKSIALLDVALRRRFVFKELMPDPEQVPEVDSLGFSLRTLLTGLNDEIAKKYDRERQIGHTYFREIRNIRDFRTVWFNRIIPLLQEYFYGDYKAMAEIIGRRFVNIDAQRIINDMSDDELREAVQELYQTNV